MHRFLQRVWKNLAGEGRAADVEPSADQLRPLHKAIKAVTESMEQLKFNTAIAALIDLNGEMLRWVVVPRTIAEAFVLMLAPLAPHLAEELWWRLGHAGSLAHEPWPEYNERLAVDPRIELPVQVMGRVRSHITVMADAGVAAVEAAALADAKVRAHTAGRTIRRVVVVPGKLVNIVTG